MNVIIIQTLFLSYVCSSYNKNSVKTNVRSERTHSGYVDQQTTSFYLTNGSLIIGNKSLKINRIIHYKTVRSNICNCVGKKRRLLTAEPIQLKFHGIQGRTIKTQIIIDKLVSNVVFSIHYKVFLHTINFKSICVKTAQSKSYAVTNKIIIKFLF